MVVNISCLGLLLNTTICSLDPYRLSEDYAVSWLDEKSPGWRNCILPDPTPSPLPTASASISRSLSPSQSVRPTPSPSSSPSVSPLPTPSPSASPSKSASPSASPSRSPAPTPTPTPIPWPAMPYLEFTGFARIDAEDSNATDLWSRLISIISYLGSVDICTDAYFLHEDRNSILPANTVIFYNFSEGLFKYPGVSTTCIDREIGLDTKIKVNIPLAPGKYYIRGSDFNYKDSKFIGLFDGTLQLYGYLKINNQIYKDPDLSMRYSFGYRFYVNGQLISPTSGEILLEVASDESSLPKSLGVAEIVVKADTSENRTVNPSKDASLAEVRPWNLVAWISSGVVLMAATACLFAWSFVRNNFSKYELTKT